MATRITVVVPVYNEAGSIDALYGELIKVFGALGDQYRYQFIFVDDGSEDGSVAAIEMIAAKDPEVRCLSLSRNFGKEAALSAGIQHADGDAIVLIDADLQHPPQVIETFVRKWEEGADVVIGVRTSNPDESGLRKLGSRVFAYIMNHLGGVPSVSGATDFRLIDRAVADEFRKFTEHGRVTRGLIDWLGFTQVYVSFVAGRRVAGVAQYGYPKLIALAFSALVSNSLLPLRFAGYLGCVITILAGLLGLFILIEQVLLGDPLRIEVTGTAMLGVMILFLNGILLVCLGLVSLYIEKIHHEAANRPLFVVRMHRSRKGT